MNGAKVLARPAAAFNHRGVGWGVFSESSLRDGRQGKLPELARRFPSHRAVSHQTFACPIFLFS
jgi:hypothetical protein